MSEISAHSVAELHSFNTLPMEQMSSTIARQFVTGEAAMLARIVLEQGAVVPEHSHHNEQISYILEGALHFRVGGQDRIVCAGEVLIIPPHVPHSATALERTVDLDIFTPPRQDWITGDDAYLRR